MVPIRAVFETLGFVVDWDIPTRTATLTSADYTVIISVGSYTFTTNGISHTLDVPAQLIGGSTMLPIAAVLRSVGHDVDWDGATRTFVIASPVVYVPVSTPAPPIEEPVPPAPTPAPPIEEPAPPTPVEEDPVDEVSDFLSHFDLDRVIEIIEYYGSDLNVPEGHVFFQPNWVMNEFSFDFHDGTARWQFIHVDGIDTHRFREFHDVGNIWGSQQWQFFLVIARDGSTSIYVDIGNVHDIWSSINRPAWFSTDHPPDWITPDFRAYYVIALD